MFLITVRISTSLSHGKIPAHRGDRKRHQRQNACRPTASDSTCATPMRFRAYTLAANLGFECAPETTRVRPNILGKLRSPGVRKCAPVSGPEHNTPSPAELARVSTK